MLNHFRTLAFSTTAPKTDSNGHTCLNQQFNLHLFCKRFLVCQIKSVWYWSHSPREIISETYEKAFARASKTTDEKEKK